MYDPFAVAVHEAGHASAAILRGIAVRSVGLTPGEAGQVGACEFIDPPVGTLAGLIDFAVVAAAGYAAEVAAFGASAGGDTGDMDRLAVIQRAARRKAPAGWLWPDPFAAARAELDSPVTWAGAISLARRIVACGGQIDGATATAIVRAGWRDTELVRRIQHFGHRAVR